MILLARRIVDGDEPVLPLLDIDVRRNAFGRQLDSFETELDVPVLGDSHVHASSSGPPSWSGRARASTSCRHCPTGGIVAVRQGHILALAFHPELSGETRFHRLLATMAEEWESPGEGSAAGVILCGARPWPETADEQPARPGESCTADRPGGARRPFPALARRERTRRPGVRSLGLPSTQQPGRLQPVPHAAGGLPFRPTSSTCTRRGTASPARPRGARLAPGRVDHRGTRCDRVDGGGRHPAAARPPPAARRGAARGPRVHVACADEGGNVELFMQAGS